MTHSNNIHTGHSNCTQKKDSSGILTIRSFSGLSGDMFCCGLAVIWLGRKNILPDSSAGIAAINGLAKTIMPLFGGKLRLVRKLVNGIGGYSLEVELPQAHEHRTPDDIFAIVENSQMTEAAKNMALKCVEMLAACEGEVHGIAPEKVHFHEVGALDSILDICLVSSLFIELEMPKIICGPLPLADGTISCAHGWLPAPAPAVLSLLPGMRVKAFPVEDAGELVTPTAAVLLRALMAEFGPWPDFEVNTTALVYGSREFASVPNGVIFAYGFV